MNCDGKFIAIRSCYVGHGDGKDSRGSPVIRFRDVDVHPYLRTFLLSVTAISFWMIVDSWIIDVYHVHAPWISPLPLEMFECKGCEGGAVKAVIIPKVVRCSI